jgi:hypothetical protein
MTIAEISFANELANNYPVTQEDALEYVRADINNAENACKIRAHGLLHRHAMFFLVAGPKNLSMFKGQDVGSIIKAFNKISEEFK